MAICRDCLTACECTILGSSTVTVTGTGGSGDAYVISPNVDPSTSPLEFSGGSLDFARDELAAGTWPFPGTAANGSPLWLNAADDLVGKPDWGIGKNIYDQEDNSLTLTPTQTVGTTTFVSSALSTYVDWTAFFDSPLDYPGRTTTTACMIVTIDYTMSGLTTTGSSFSSVLKYELNPGVGPGPVTLDKLNCITLLSGQTRYGTSVGRFLLSWDAGFHPVGQVDLTPGITWNFGTVSGGLTNIPLRVRWETFLVPSRL